MRRALVLTSLLCLSAAWPAPAGAQPAVRRAAIAFAAGRDAYEAGRFDEALVQFRTAYELTHEPDLLYNIAQVADRLRRDAEALEAYEGYLRARPGAEDRANVEARIENLRRVIREREAAMTRTPPEVRVTTSEGAGATPWVIVGASAAVLAAGAVLLGVGLADVASVEGAPVGSDWRDYQEAAQRGPILVDVGIVAAALGVVGVAAGVLVWALDPPRTVTVGVGPGGVIVAGRL